MENVGGFLSVMGFLLMLEFCYKVYSGGDGPSTAITKWMNSVIPGTNKPSASSDTSGDDG